MNFRHIDQGVLKFGGGHVGISKGVPVDYLDGTAKCLRHLIGCSGHVFSTGTRSSGQVSHTLNCFLCLVYIQSLRGKLTNVTGHLRKVIDGFIGVIIQIIQRRSNILHGVLTASVCFDDLNGVHLRLVLRQTSLYRVNCKSRGDSFAGINCLVRNIYKGGYSHDIQR